MSKIVTFLTNHWLLVGAFVIAFIWLIIEEGRHQGAGGARQTPDGVTALINHDNAVVVDLREDGAFSDGHITGSVNVPFARIDQSMGKLEKYKQRPMVLVCAMGQNSTQAMNKLRKAGFDKLYILGGGLGQWKKSNMPLVKGKG